MSTVNKTTTTAAGATHTSSRGRRWVFSLLSLVLVVIMLLKWEDFQEPSREASTIVKAVEVPKIQTTERLRPIKQISILGERNSGTRWTFDHISECFNHSVVVTKGLTRYKHWFQHDDPSRYRHDTLVLAQFRNPYDWLKAMEHVPHHSPAHLRTKRNASLHTSDAANDWYVFLTKPWTMPRVGSDLLIKDPTTMCQERFMYRDINSCAIEPLPREAYKHTLRYSEHQPFYEMRNDGSGQPYANILEMRTDKIRNMLSVVDYEGVADAWVVQYEYLLSKGTDALLRKIEQWTGLQRHCKAKDPQNRRQKKSRFVTKEFAQHLHKHLNWTVEEWIGYSLEPSREDALKEW